MIPNDVTIDTGQGPAEPEERYYGGSITVHGRNLVTSLIAGETITFTRIVVGSGRMPDGIEPLDMTELVHPVADATSTVPIVENGDLYLTVEYRNDLNGGLKENFWLDEFGIFAKTEKSEEILFYYATLGDSPQPVHAYQNNRIDIRRYPVTISLLLEDGVEVAFKPGSFITSEDAMVIISGMVNRAMGHFSSAIITEIVIPRTGWVNQTGEAGYDWSVDVPVTGVTAEYYPNITLHKDALGTAANARVCPVIQTLKDAVRIWAKNAPSADMAATAAFLSSGLDEKKGSEIFTLPAATTEKLGVVKIGPGLSVADDGTVSVDGPGIAVPDNEVSEMLDTVFGNDTTQGEEAR